MVAFPLFSLHSILLEKVINKFAVRSYCRFLKTCRSAYSFVQGSRHICVFADGEFHFGEDLLYLPYVPSSRLIKIEADGLYKTRLEIIVFAEYESQENFKTFRQAMKEHCVTCTQLIILDVPLFVRDVAEEYTQLVDILKPMTVYLNSQGSRLYEAILSSTTVKFVEVCLYPKEADIAAPQLLSSFETVKICVNDQSAVKDTYNWLLGILQSLYSHARPNLREFVYEINWDDEVMYSGNEFEKRFGVYGFELEFREGKALSGALILPEHFPTGASCLVNVFLRKSNYYVEIKYSREEYDASR